MRRLRLLVLLVPAALAASPALGQAYLLHQHGVAEGLGHVRSLAPDPAGGLWLATARGLLRHDGVRFTPVALGPGPALPAHGVAAGPDGALWVWAGDGLYRRGPDGAVARLALPAPLAASLAVGFSEQLRLRPLRDGRLALVDDRSGLWLYAHPGRWARPGTPTPADPTVDVAEDGAGGLWLLTRRRFGRLVLPPRDAPPHGAPARLTWLAGIERGMHVRPHPAGAWVLTELGLFLYRRDAGALTEVLDPRHRCWYASPAVTPAGALAAVVEGDGGKWLAVLAPDGRLRLRLDEANGLRTASLDAARYDREGGLWLASEHGLDHLEDAGRLVTHALPTSDGVFGLRVSPADGTLWAATYGALLRFEGGAFVRVGPARAATPPVFGPDGAAHWVGFGGRPFRRWGFRYTNGRVEPRPLDRLYGATLPDGRRLYTRFDRATAAPVPARVAVVFDDGRVLAEGRELGGVAVGPPPRRRVWLLLDGRLDTVEGDALGSGSAATPPSVRTALDRLAGLEVYDVEADRLGRLWIPTRRGLAMLAETAPDEWRVRFFGPSDGLRSEGVRGLDVAGGVRLWLGTDRGVQGFTLHAGAPVLRPIPLPGLNAHLPTEVVRDVAEDGAGDLWVAPAGPPRLLRYRPGGPPLPSPALRLSGVAVNGRPVPAPRRLRADTTRLALAFAPATLRRLRGLRYEYRLLGLDTAWTAFDGEPTLRLDHLAPGRYTVEARAVRDGQPPGPVLRQALVLTPPFYRADWFFALCALGLVGATAGAAWRRTRGQARRRRELEALVAVRTHALVEEKRTTEAQAHRLAELGEAKGRFFANVSHELRTPLTLLLGPLRDARAGRFGPVSGPLARQLPLMQRNAERLLHLVEELLDLARLDAGRLRLRRQRTDLVPFLRSLVLAFAGRAEREGVALAFDADAARLEAWVDRERLEQVVGNLLANAFRFTPAGGRIRVRLRRDGAPAGSAPGRAVIEVRDSGQGIAPALLPHVFERFRQGAGEPAGPHDGAGIGLALAREVVDRHGGTITAESEPGFGATFIVRLPLGEGEGMWGDGGVGEGGEGRERGEREA